MIEEDFFEKFYDELDDEIDNKKFISDLKNLIESRNISKAKYQKLIKNHYK